MKPGPKDIKVFLTFSEAELELLQDNTWQMAEAFGLDRRIANLTGKRKVGFYGWDLDCLEAVISDIKTQPDVDILVSDKLYDKILQAMDFIDQNRKK